MRRWIKSRKNYFNKNPRRRIFVILDASISRILFRIFLYFCGDDHLSRPKISHLAQADFPQLRITLHRIGVFHRVLLPVRAVSFYFYLAEAKLIPREGGLTLFTLTSSTIKTFRVFLMTIGGIVSVTLSRSWRPLAAISNAA